MFNGKPLHAISGDWSDKLSDDYMEKMFKLRDLMDRGNSLKYTREETPMDYVNDNLLYNVSLYTLLLIEVNRDFPEENAYSAVETMMGYNRKSIEDYLNENKYITTNKKGADAVYYVLDKFNIDGMEYYLEEYDVKEGKSEEETAKKLLKNKRFVSENFNTYFPTKEGLDLINTDLFGMLPAFSNKFFIREIVEYSKEHEAEPMDVLLNFLDEYYNVSKERKDHTGIMGALHAMYFLRHLAEFDGGYYYLIKHIIAGYNPVFLDEEFLEPYPLTDLAVADSLVGVKEDISLKELLKLFNKVWDEYEMDLILDKKDMRDIIKVMAKGEYSKDFEMEMRFKYLLD